MVRTRVHVSTAHLLLSLPALFLGLSCGTGEPPEPTIPEGETEVVFAPEVLETEAGAALTTALEHASGTDRLLFVHTGADW